MTAPTLSVKQAKALLKELASVSEHASLTGAFSDGLPSARDKMNWLMAWAEAREIAPPGFFRPLGPASGWGEIGVEARMMTASLSRVDEDEEDDLPSPDEDDEVPDDDDDDLSSFFGDGLGRKLRKLKKLKNLGRRGQRGGPGIKDPGVLVAMAPFLDSEDLAAMVMEHMEEGGEFDEGLLVALAPFLGSQTLGRLIRARMKRKVSHPQPPEPPMPPNSPSPQEEPKIPESYASPAPAAPAGEGQPQGSSAPSWTQHEGAPHHSPSSPALPESEGQEGRREG